MFQPYYVCVFEFCVTCSESKFVNRLVVFGKHVQDTVCVCSKNKTSLRGIFTDSPFGLSTLVSGSRNLEECVCEFAVFNFFV